MNFKKSILILLAISFLFFLPEITFSFSPVDSGVTSKIGNQTTSFYQSAGFSTMGPYEIISGVIKSILSLLALIFIVLMIFNGYRWMTAGGNEDAVKKAKTGITNAIIGLVVIILAYAITAFIFSRLPGGTVGNIGGGS